jgi:putative transposase
LEALLCVEKLTRTLGSVVRRFSTPTRGAVYWRGVYQEASGAGILTSVDGRGRALDNVMVERLWHRVKYEEIYLWHLCRWERGLAGIEPVFLF